MNTPSEVRGVLARIADGLPRTPDAKGYRRLFTQAANHLLRLAHPPNDLRHAINSRQDTRSSINASRERRHENEIRRREEYDRDHGIPARSQATRTESATASTGGTTRGRSRNHNNYSPPRDRHHPRRGSSINVTFPRTLQGLGVHLKELHESDTPFFGIVPTEGEYPLGHIYMPVTFGTPENYRTEFLRFEVANFDCGYNAIIGRPRLAKFMAIPHYMYMILKMPGPQ
jgi:hypothetical protein